MREVLDAEVISHEPKFLNKICTVSLVAKRGDYTNRIFYMKNWRNVSQLCDWDNYHYPDVFARELA